MAPSHRMRAREDAVRPAREAGAAAMQICDANASVRAAGTVRAAVGGEGGASQDGTRSISGGRRSDTAPDACVAPRPPPPAGYTRPAYYAWADLLRRTFAIDVLACAACGGRLRLLATITDVRVIRRILTNRMIRNDECQLADIASQTISMGGSRAGQRTLRMGLALAIACTLPAARAQGQGSKSFAVIGGRSRRAINATAPTPRG